MTNSMDKTASRVTDERLAQLIETTPDDQHTVTMSSDALRSILTELQSLRSLSSDSVSSAKRVELITNALLHLPIRGRELEFAAQQVDLALSQAGAFALDSGTGGQQPVALGRDDLDEWIIGELSNAKALSTDGMSVMTTTATVLRAVREALSVCSPTEPKTGVVSEDRAKLLAEVISLIEDDMYGPGETGEAEERIAFNKALRRQINRITSRMIVRAALPNTTGEAE